MKDPIKELSSFFHLLLIHIVIFMKMHNQNEGFGFKNRIMSIRTKNCDLNGSASMTL